ncbi:MAG: formylglycine-generating enzyme family protein [Gammaproteobacteria bacterium]|nr:formylglycine-generating enzyme family protein [Gammaproteobacteria bacterium]
MQSAARLRRTVPAGLAISAALVCGCGGAAAPDAPEMLLVPGGEFTMGANDGLPFEGPAHTVALDGFLLDRYEVTNARFAEFADATGHVTESERLGWSGVFDTRRGGWTRGDGADWRHPSGPGSSHRDMGDYPVVHVCWCAAAA